jgi:hypothetical protein
MDQLLDSRRRQAANVLGVLDVSQLQTLNQLLDAVLDSLTGPPAASPLELRRAS